MYINLHVKYTLFLSDFNESDILHRASIDTQRSNFIKIRPVKAELFHADRRSYMAELIVAFRDFVNAPNNAEKALKLARIPEAELLTLQLCSRARSQNCEKDH